MRSFACLASIVCLVGCQHRATVQIPDRVQAIEGTIEGPVASGIVLGPPSAVGTLIDGKCSVCQKAGLKSTVVMDGGGSCTAMYCGSGYYDEDGKFHAPKDCNTCTYRGKCSRGHSILVFIGGGVEVVGK